VGMHILKSKIQCFFGGTFLPLKKWFWAQQRFLFWIKLALIRQIFEFKLFLN
jgi:hypothetical protein